MKKSQSIFLLSGLVPLVAAPIAIVASCSSDSTATTFSLKTNVTLTGLADDQKDPNQYAGAGADTKKKLADLIVAKKDQIFNNPPADLKADQIQITNDVTANTSDGSLTFKLKVVSTTTSPTDLIGETDVTLKGFTATPTSDTSEQTLVNNAVAEIEKAHTDKTFKLKGDKETIPQSEIDALKTNPANFLTQYTDGLPMLDPALSTTVKQANFSVADKPAGSKQQTTKQQIITFKVTVSHSTAQIEKDTKDLTFEFTLQQTTTVAKVQTTAKPAVTATDLSLQADKVSVAQPKLNEAWVVANITKLVNGDQEVTVNGDVLALSVTPNNQDSTKLNLSFKLAAQKWYQADGTLGNAESAAFTFEITGFTKADQAQVKKAEFATSELGQGFETKPFAELNQLMNKAKWLFDNKEKYLNGDLVPGTTDKNFISGGITFTPKANDQTKADMTFSIAAGRSYDAQGQVTTTATRITFTVTNIKT